MRYFNIYIWLIIGLNLGCSTIKETSNGQRIDITLEIAEEKYINVGGIEQWITIKGVDRTKPAILFIHGGPGSPISPYSETIYNEWKSNFVLIQWDQRGTGRSYGKNAPNELNKEFLSSNPLQLEQMVDDGIELSKYLLKHLKKEKIILFGESWGSILAVKMISKNPKLFHSYFGTSQIVNPSEDLILAYNQVYDLALKEEDQKSIEQLNEIGKPSYYNGMKAGKLYRIIKSYERKYSTAIPENWYKPTVKYDNKEDEKNRFEGDDYSFFNFIGDKELGITGMNKDINLMKETLDLKIPVYLFQGKHDILSPFEISKPFYDSLNQKNKEYFLFENVGHGIHPDILKKQYELLIDNFQN